MRRSSPASISLYFDSDVLRIPFLAILPPLPASQKKEYKEFQGITRLLDIDINQQEERNTVRQKEIQN